MKKKIMFLALLLYRRRKKCKIRPKKVIYQLCFGRNSLNLSNNKTIVAKNQQPAAKPLPTYSNGATGSNSVAVTLK